MSYFSRENWIDSQTGYPRFVKIALHVVILVVLLAQFPLGVVGAGERGVKFNRVSGGVGVVNEGLFFRLPFIEKVKTMDVKVQKEEVEASAASKDLQTVSSRVALNFHLNPEKVADIFRGVSLDYKSRIIDPAIQESVKASTAKFTAEELITKREVVKEDMRSHLRERLVEQGVLVDDLNIVDFDFSKTFNEAIEAKVTAEQQALAAKNKLEQIKYEKEQAIVSAQGRAEALQVEGNALRNNPQIAELRAIEKWDGHLPQVTSGATPFINLNR